MALNLIPLEARAIYEACEPLVELGAFADIEIPMGDGTYHRVRLKVDGSMYLSASRTDVGEKYDSLDAFADAYGI